MPLSSTEFTPSSSNGRTMAADAIPDAIPTRARRKQARPAELLQAATQLFVHKGYAATRVEEVAQMAHVSKGTLFLYYPSKAALLEAVVRENLVGHFAQWQQELEAFSGSTEALIRHAFEVWRTRIVKSTAGGVCKLLTQECGNFPELGNFYLREVVQPGHALVRRILQRGVERKEFRPLDLDACVHLILSPMFYFNHWQHTLAPHFPLSLGVDEDAFFDAQVDNLLRGLRAPAA